MPSSGSFCITSFARRYQIKTKANGVEVGVVGAATERTVALLAKLHAVFVDAALTLQLHSRASGCLENPARRAGAEA